MNYHICTMLNREATLHRLRSGLNLRKKIQAGIIVSDSGCWEWQKYRDKRGYGVIGFRGTPIRAHTVTWFLRYGTLPEEGRTLDHLCNNTRCCNPVHLRDCTSRENIQRAAMQISHCPKGHPYDMENTSWSGGNRFCKTCKRDGQKTIGPRRYAQLKALGKCVKCGGRNAAERKSMCQECLIAHAARNRKARVA